MLVREWIKRIAVIVVGMATVVCVATLAMLQLFWLKEAGPPPSPFSFVESLGTGFFVTSDGWLVTNAHVTAGCSRVSIGNRALSGLVADRILYPTDRQLDLAAVHVKSSIPAFLKFAAIRWPSRSAERPASHSEITKVLNYAIAEIGPDVSITGFPGYDQGDSPVTLQGEVSGATTFDQQHWFLRVKAPVRPGSSGSPVLDTKGEAVGIVFRGSSDLPKGSSAALIKSALQDLPSSATHALVVPAPVVEAFLGGADPGYASTSEANSGDHSAAVVRVFCFR